MVQTAGVKLSESFSAEAERSNVFLDGILRERRNAKGRVESACVPALRPSPVTFLPHPARGRGCGRRQGGCFVQGPNEGGAFSPSAHGLQGLWPTQDARRDKLVQSSWTHCTWWSLHPDQPSGLKQPACPSLPQSCEVSGCSWPFLMLASLGSPLQGSQMATVAGDV